MQDLRKKKRRRALDVLVSWPRKGGQTLELRLCIRSVAEKKSWAWLLTSLPRTLSADSIGQLYVQLVAEGRAISTRIAAQPGPHILPLLALFATRGFRATRLEPIFAFFINSAASTHPERRKYSYGHVFGLEDFRPA